MSTCFRRTFLLTRESLLWFGDTWELGAGSGRQNGSSAIRTFPLTRPYRGCPEKGEAPEPTLLGGHVLAPRSSVSQWFLLPPVLPADVERPGQDFQNAERIDARNHAFRMSVPVLWWRGG